MTARRSLSACMHSAFAKNCRRESLAAIFARLRGKGSVLGPGVCAWREKPGNEIYGFGGSYLISSCNARYGAISHHYITVTAGIETYQYIRDLYIHQVVVQSSSGSFRMTNFFVFACRQFCLVPLLRFVSCLHQNEPCMFLENTLFTKQWEICLLLSSLKSSFGCIVSKC